MMRRIAVVVSFAFLISGYEGVQLTLDRDVQPTGGRRPICGVLTCREWTQGGETSTTAAPGQADLSGQVSEVTSMTIFKTVQGDPARVDAPVSRRLLATLTSQRPRLTRVSDGVKVDGTLGSPLTTVTLELVKQEDCRADFTCEVIAVDNQGRQLLRSSHLQQLEEETGDPAGQGGWTPAVASQLVDLVQRLHTDLALTKTAVSEWNEKFDDLKDGLQKIEGRVASCEKDSGDTMDRLEDNLTRLLEAKALSAERALGDKLETIADDMLSAFSRNLSQIEASLKTSVGDNLVTLKKEIAKGGQQTLENLTDAVESMLFTTSTDLAHRVSDGISVLQASLEEDMQELSLTISKTSSEAQTAVGNIVSGMDSLSVKNVKSAVGDLFIPKTCKKGEMAVRTETSYPYPVIYPSGDDNLSFPYLCDTLTDGGGWIIIQRRTTEDVDFYQRWAQYKKGFGTLDSNFWLGNDNIHAITSQGVYELKVDLKYDGKSAFAHYKTFSLADEQNKYALSVGSYDGTAGDSLAYHNGQAFSTLDRNNNNGLRNCAVARSGAWWYDNCHDSNLNGKWGKGHNGGPSWTTFSGGHAVTYSEMKIRRVGN